MPGACNGCSAEIGMPALVSQNELASQERNQPMDGEAALTASHPAPQDVICRSGSCLSRRPWTAGEITPETCLAKAVTLEPAHACIASEYRRSVCTDGVTPSAFASASRQR